MVPEAKVTRVETCPKIFNRFMLGKNLKILHLLIQVKFANVGFHTTHLPSRVARPHHPKKLKCAPLIIPR